MVQVRVLQGIQRNKPARPKDTVVKRKPRAAGESYSTLILWLNSVGLGVRLQARAELCSLCCEAEDATTGGWLRKGLGRDGMYGRYSLKCG